MYGLWLWWWLLLFLLLLLLVLLCAFRGLGSSTEVDGERKCPVIIGRRRR